MRAGLRVTVDQHRPQTLMRVCRLSPSSCYIHGRGRVCVCVCVRVCLEAVHVFGAAPPRQCGGREGRGKSCHADIWKALPLSPKCVCVCVTARASCPHPWGLPLLGPPPAVLGGKILHICWCVDLGYLRFGEFVVSGVRHAVRARVDRYPAHVGVTVFAASSGYCMDVSALTLV
jgi:hypothetical protein